MIYPSIDKLLNKIGSKYLLVNLVSVRVKELEAKGGGNYYFSEEKLKNLIKFYVTENVVNEKLYLNGLRVQKINEDF